MSTVVINVSGTIWLTSSNKRHSLTINWPPSGTDLSDTTIQSIKLQFDCGSTYYYVYTYTNNTGTAITTGTFSGNQASPITCNLAANAWQNVTSGSVTVSFRRYCDMVGAEWGNVSYTNIKLIVKYQPNEVIVGSQASVATVNAGESQTVVLSNDSDKVSHIVQWVYPGEDVSGNPVSVQETKTLARSIWSTSWAVPEVSVYSICRKFYNTNIATGTFYVTTMNGSDVVASDVPFTAQLILPVSLVGPEFESTPITITSSNPTVPYLQNNATLTVVPHLNPKYNATITKIQISTPDYSDEVSASTASFSFPLKTSGTYPITVTATDSRGYSVSYTDSTTVTVVPCSNPSFSSLDVARCDSQGVLDDEQTYAKISVSASAIIGSSSSPALISYNVKAYESSSSVLYNEATFTTSPYIFGSQNEPFEADKSYLLRITATATGTVSGQTVSTTSTIDAYINTSTYTIYRMAGGKGIAFGDVARQFGVEVKSDWPFYTHGKEIAELLVDVAHPIGSIIETLDAMFDPNEEWPWTHWSLLKDCFLYGAGTESVLSKGGSASTPFSFSIPSQSVTLTADNLPKTTIIGAGSIDKVYGPNGNQSYEEYKGSSAVDKRNHGSVTGYAYYDLKRDPDSITINGGSVSTTISTMPPYVAANIWTRIQ